MSLPEHFWFGATITFLYIMGAAGFFIFLSLGDKINKRKLSFVIFWPLVILFAIIWSTYGYSVDKIREKLPYLRTEKLQ